MPAGSWLNEEVGASWWRTFDVGCCRNMKKLWLRSVHPGSLFALRPPCHCLGAAGFLGPSISVCIGPFTLIMEGFKRSVSTVQVTAMWQA